MPESSTIQARTAPPELNQIYSKDDRKVAGIGSAYVDMYNDSQLAKYNNEYNYWLWQQQADYNSPANQVARAKEAGLNPNVIAGNVSSGNLQSTPESKANYRSNIFGNKMQAINTSINAFNSVLNAVKDGVQAVSGISGIPDDISTYRHLLTQSAGQDYGIKLADRIAKNIHNVQNGYLTFGQKFPWVIENSPYLSPSAFGKSNYQSNELMKALEGSQWYEGVEYGLTRQARTNAKIWQDFLNAVKTGNLIDQRSALAQAQSLYQTYQNDWFNLNKGILPWLTLGTQAFRLIP